jgi:hypothetical protein
MPRKVREVVEFPVAARRACAVPRPVATESDQPFAVSRMRPPAGAVADPLGLGARRAVARSSIDENESGGRWGFRGMNAAVMSPGGTAAAAVLSGAAEIVPCSPVQFR